MTDPNDTTQKVDTSRFTDRGWLMNFIRWALGKGYYADAAAAQDQLSKLKTDQAHDELDLKAAERDRRQGKES